MTWRREVEALVGTPGATPALLMTLDAGEVRCRLVADAAAPAGLVEPARAAPPALRTAVTTLSIRDGALAWVGVSFLGNASPAARRRALLAEAARVLAAAGTLVVVDHNRPRRRLAAMVAVGAPPRPPGGTPAAAWRRLAWPTAREVRGAGLVVDRLRLAAGERVQVVFARHADHARRVAAVRERE